MEIGELIIKKCRKKDIQKFVESTKECNFVEKLDKSIDMKKAPPLDVEKIGINPFTQTLEIPVTEIISNIDLTEDTDGTVINKKFYREKTTKVELYMHECARDNVAGLSDKAQRLLLHVMYTLDTGKDYYWLNKQHYMNSNKIKSQTTVSNAINELIRYRYILKTCMQGWLWINPYRFYPGSRLQKYPNNKKVVDKWDQTKGESYQDKKKRKPFRMSLKEENTKSYPYEPGE